MRRFFGKLLAVLVFGILAVPPSAFCQVDTAWVRRYNGPGDSTDVANAIAVDDSGNVVVSGYSLGRGGSYTSDFATIKYDRNGNETWIQRYNGGWNQAEDLALDKQGNVYVTGVTGDFEGYPSAAWATVKYDSQGNQLWVARYQGPMGGQDWPHSVTVGKGGCVYVVGASRSTNPGPGCSGPYSCYDFVTIKYDSSGNQLWVARYSSGQDYTNSANLLAVDNGGNVYIGGYSRPYDALCPRDWEFVKYDSTGKLLWVRTYHPWSLALKGAPADLKLDAKGNIYITGGSDDSLTHLDYTTIKYDSLGNQLWLTHYNGPGNSDDWAISMALDAEGNTYVTGYSGGVGTDFDMATIKYDSLGNQLWVRRYNGPGNGYDGGDAIAVDSIGNVYVSGWGIGSGASADYTTIKYDSLGNQLWVMRYDGNEHSIDEAQAMTIDTRGNVYVTGQSVGSLKPGDYDYLTIKYSPLPTLKGDLNLDGVLTMADVVLMLNFTFGAYPFPAAPTAADLNCDGAVSPADVVVMLQIFFLSAATPC